MGRKADYAPSKGRRIVAWLLSAIWLGLMVFGLVSVYNPPWLQELSRHGILVESQDYKDYGDDLLKKGDYRLAAAQYQRALKIKPDDAGSLVNLAIAYARLGAADRGIQLLRDALHSGTNREGVIYYNLGELFERRGEQDKAIESYQRVLGTEVDPDLIYRRLGALYLDAEDYSAAREAFQRVLDYQTDLTISYRSMLNRSLDLLASDSTVLSIIKESLRLGVTEELLSRYDLQTIRRTTQFDPEIAKTHNHLGLISAQLGDLDQAVYHFEASSRIWPGNIDAVRNLQELRQYRQRQSRDSS